MSDIFEDLSGFIAVIRHLNDERIEAVEFQFGAQIIHKRDRKRRAVEVAFEIK